MDLRIRNLSFLDWSGIDLDLSPRSVVCLLGDSGSGKSLLLRAIADLIVNEGRVELEGKERGAYSPQEWRRLVGYLPAEINWWEDTVGGHFESRPSKELLERLRLPATALEWEPSRLSMGERQRLGFLRMLDRTPSVLLLDEPTANLDDEAASELEEEIQAYVRTQDASVLWVTHSRAQARRVAAQTLRMEKKRLAPVEDEEAGI